MNVLAYVGAFVLFAALWYPVSAEAFGRAPSSAEVNQTGTVHHHHPSTPSSTSTSATTVTDPNGAPGTPHAVPEPSSFVLVAIAIGFLAVSLKRNRLVDKT